MKVVILAGGFGTRISEESYLKPKPMIEIGGFPIIVHIMNIYSSQGFNDFVICAGYKQEVIKEYFAHYYLYSNDVTFDMAHPGAFSINSSPKSQAWRVTVCDTGLHTQTGGRIKRIQKYVGNETFMVTYGDAVGNINIKELLETHKRNRKIGTMSLYNFGQAKGVVDLDDNGKITDFREKSDLDGDLINIGFMVFEPAIFDLIDGDSSVLEHGPLQTLASQGELCGYVHKGFWQCMDTLNEKNKLENLWNTGNAPWKIWRD